MPRAPQAVGGDVTCVIRAEDIVVSAEPVPALSERNVFSAHVLECVRTGADVTIRCGESDADAKPWLVRLTPAAVASLALAPGRPVWLAIKSHSVRLV